MIIHVDREGTLQTLGNALHSLAHNPSVKSILVLTCDENHLPEDDFGHILDGVSIPVFGGIFPAVVNGTEHLSRGCILVGLPFQVETHVIPGLSDPDTDYERLLEETVPENEHLRTLLILVDGTASRISAFIEGLYNVFGLEINYVGGGAGSLSLEKTSCLFNNTGIFQDCALLVEMETESGIGVAHGWEAVQGPFKVTETNRNVIKTLDWEPALSVYERGVESHSMKPFDRTRFFEEARNYPFGIAKLRSEPIVRDPFKITGREGLACVGEVPEGSFVYILHGNADTAIPAARTAKEIARRDLGPDSNPAGGLVFDCASRALSLKNRFGEELEAINDADIPMIGACCIGEIANSGKDYLELYNKTVVVALLEDA